MNEQNNYALAYSHIITSQAKGSLIRIKPIIINPLMEGSGFEFFIYSGTITKIDSTKESHTVHFLTPKAMESVKVDDAEWAKIVQSLNPNLSD